MKFRSLLLFLSLITMACGGSVIVVSGVEVYERYWLKAVDQLEPRASFDLSCPATQLSWSLFRKQGRYPMEVGVEGCGNRAVYLRINPRMPWLLNNRAGQGGQAGQPAAGGYPQPQGAGY